MYSIIRTKYHKQEKLTKVDNHNRRITPQENVVEGGEFDRVFGDREQPLSILVNQKLDDLNVEKPAGKMAEKVNVAMEFMITASPEFFENCTNETFENWKNKQIEWAKNTFGQRLVAIDYHNDELTPHFHLTVVPVKEIKRKNRQGKKQKARGEKATYTTKRVLSQSTIFTPESLEKLCTKYADFNKEFGLVRGEYRRRNRQKVNHRTIKEHREIVGTELPNAVKKLNELERNIESKQNQNDEIDRILNEKSDKALDIMSDYIRPITAMMKNFITEVERSPKSADFSLVEAEFEKAPKVAQNALQESYDSISSLNSKLKR